MLYLWPEALALCPGTLGGGGDEMACTKLSSSPPPSPGTPENEASALCGMHGIAVQEFLLI